MQTSNPHGPVLEIRDKIRIIASFPITIPGKKYRLGRHSSNDFIIFHDQISRHHCTIQRDWDDTVILSDLDNTNPTIINGHEISGPVEIYPDDDIRIGHLSISLSVSDISTLQPDTSNADQFLPNKKAFRSNKPGFLFIVGGCLLILASLLIFVSLLSW